MLDRTGKEDIRKDWFNKNVLAMGLTSLFSDMSHEMVTAVLPFFITLILGGNAAIVGLVEGGSDAASGVVKVFSGHFSDRIKRTPIIRLGYSLTAFLKPMISFVNSWQQLFLLRVSAWAGRGARGPPRDALLAESVDPPNTGKAFGFHRTMDTIGAIAGPAIAFMLLPYLSYRGVILFSILPGILSVLFVLTIRDFKRKIGYARSFVFSVRSYRKEFYYFLIAVGLFGVSNFSNVMFTLRAEEILQPIFGSFEATQYAILLYTLLNFVYALASLPVGYLADKYSKRKLLALGYTLFSIAALLSSFTVYNTEVLLLTFICAGFCTAVVDTTEAAYCNELLGSSAKGLGFGIMQTTNSVGDFTSSFIVGFLWSSFSPMIAFTFASALSFISALFLLVTLRM
jgi:MFS family permease